MKFFKRNPLLVIIALAIFSFTSCTKENAKITRSLEEVKTLIQNDNLTKVYKERKQNEILSLFDRRITDSKELEQSLKKVTQEISLAYYNEIVDKYEELSPLPFEQQMEIIYDIRLNDLIQKAEELNEISQHRQTSCEELEGMMANLANVEITLMQLGLTGMGTFLGNLLDGVIGLYVNSCM